MLYSREDWLTRFNVIHYSWLFSVLLPSSRKGVYLLPAHFPIHHIFSLMALVIYWKILSWNQFFIKSLSMAALAWRNSQICHTKNIERDVLLHSLTQKIYAICGSHHSVLSSHWPSTESPMICKDTPQFPLPLSHNSKCTVTFWLSPLETHFLQSL